MAYEWDGQERRQDDYRLSRLYQEVFTGNGHDSLTTRISRLEENMDSVIKAVEDIRSIAKSIMYTVLAGSFAITAALVGELFHGK